MARRRPGVLIVVWNRAVRALILPAAVLVLWTVVSGLGMVDPGLLPAPHRILTTLWSVREEVPILVVTLLGRAMRGFLIGGLSGIGIGLVFGYSRWARERFVFTLDLLRLVPFLALFPLLPLWLGILGIAGRADIVVVALGVFPVVAIRTVEVVRGLDPGNPLPAPAPGGLPSATDRSAAVSVMIARFLEGVRSPVAAALGLAVAIELLGQAGLIVGVSRGIVDRDAATVISTTLMSTWLLFAVLTVGTDLLLGAAARAFTIRTQGWLERSESGSVVSAVGERGVVEEPAQPLAKPRGLTVHRLILLLGVLVVWVWASGNGPLNRVFLPTPSDLIELFAGGRGYRPDAGGPFVEALLGAVWVTARGVPLGLLIGTACGLLAALVLASSRWARVLLAFSMKIVRPAPLYTAVPLSLLWFGSGVGAHLAAVALAAFLILTIYASDAVGYISDSNGRVDALVGRAGAMSAMLPHLIAGLRLAVATAWGLSVLTELMGASVGLGPGLMHLAVVSMHYYLDVAPGLLITFLYAGMAIVSDYLLRAVARRYRPLYTPLGLVGQQLPRS